MTFSTTHPLYPNISSLDIANTTYTNLGGGGVFTGSFVDVSGYAQIRVAAFSNVASSTNGLALEWSSDAATVILTDSLTLVGGVANNIVQPIRWQYVRLKYTNGGSATTTLAIQFFLLSTDFPAGLGQTLMSNSIPVVLASNQSTIPVTASFTKTGLVITHSTASVGVASATALAANPNRAYLLLINASPNNIYLKFNVAAVLNEGIWLKARGGSYEFGGAINTPDTRAINAIADVAASLLLIAEGV